MKKHRWRTKPKKVLFPVDSNSMITNQRELSRVVNMALPNQKLNIAESRTAETCPYCQSQKFVKRGLRKNQLGVVQLYLCRNQECGRVFTAQDVKGRKFPLNLVIECLNYYNLGFNFQQTCSFIKQKFRAAPDPQTLSSWVGQYKSLCRFERMRPWAIKMYKPQDMVETVTMAHRQIFRFRYHRAKMRLLLEEFGNRYFGPLKEYLDNVSSETPHQYFEQGERMSDIRSKFNKADMIVKAKTNYANRLAAFVLQAVKLNKDRHEALQRFFVANDSCTVATEVPVYIRKEDIEHMQNVLGFSITGADVENAEIKTGTIKFRAHAGKAKAKSAAEGLPRLLTGHIDLIQVRNGSVYLLDYKPNAAKETPIEQLTWYAMAMSRLTGLRLFDFKCGWFDEKNYYQFFPLHVVKKIRSAGTTKRKRIVHFKDGTNVEVPQENLGKVIIA